VAFWRKVFDVLPPAFIKEFPDPENVSANASLEAFQGEIQSNVSDDAQRALIKGDHMRGDKRAATHGESLQLELCDASTIRTPKRILTYKKRVDYSGRIFIVGWCAPVEMPDANVDGDVIFVREFGGQPVFEVAPPVDEEHTLNVGVGASVQHRAAPAQPA
jgi:hypothetical protein